MGTECSHPIDSIPLEVAATLGAVLLERIRRTPDGLAYREFDSDHGCWTDTTWAVLGQEVARWRAALQNEGFSSGERVALLLPNCRAWVCCDLAAQSLGLVTVPLYLNDRPDNIIYILNHSGARLLVAGMSGEWAGLEAVLQQAPNLQRIVTIGTGEHCDPRCLPLAEWLPATTGPLETCASNPDDLASIVYTSGTTGQGKGVMLSHRNILWDIQAALGVAQVSVDDLFLSFLPLSHTLERTVGLYLPLVAGAAVAFARSVPQLAEDLVATRPTILVTVPRIFERVHNRIQEQLACQSAIARSLFRLAVAVGWRRFLYQQGRARPSPALALWPLCDRLVAAKIRARLGGRLRFAVCGGAALSATIAHPFLALGVPILQGYGLTEASPIISGNPLEDNVPESVGPPLPGLEIRITDQHELLVRGPNVMLGYWRDLETTRTVLDPDGWLHTGDQVQMAGHHLQVIGRLKELIILANGKKVAPSDMELAIALDPLIEQVLVIGEGRPFLTALLVPEPMALAHLMAALGLAARTPLDHPHLLQAVLERVAQRLTHLPGYARILRVALVPKPWTLDDGLMTPTLKLRRGPILEYHAEQVQQLYQGHS